MRGSHILLLLVGTCLFVTEASPSRSTLHQRLRRGLSVRETVDQSACNDKPQCATSPSVCTDDLDLASALCPLKCGACTCEDTVANCTDLIPEICEGSFGVTLCSKTCNMCGQTEETCFDHVTGISCADLPDPCNDDLGKVACPKFCGICTAATTTAPRTTATTTPATTTAAPVTTAPTSKPTGNPCAVNPCLNSGVCSVSSTNSYGYVCSCLKPYSGSICQIKEVPTTTPAATTQSATTKAPTTTATTNKPSTGSCPNSIQNQNYLPCQDGEIVFLIEYASSDSTSSIDHEGDFIKELIDAWRIKDEGIRIGVVVYHDTVKEAIHIDDFPNDPSGLKNRIDRVTRNLRPSGTADLAKALDYVKANSFTGARPGAVKVVIPIIHSFGTQTKNNIEAAAQRLKDDCTSIVGIVVGGGDDLNLDYTIIQNAVSQPYKDFYSYYRSFNDLENTGKYVHYFAPGCRVS